MKNIKICVHRGAMSFETETKCRECLSPLPQDTLFHICKRRHSVRPKCETVVADRVHFCPKCGAKKRVRLLAFEKVDELLN